uniref:Uncharacterized protein n=1 Tax=Setaria viridis TaxID=4556 RepID=A0A4U6UGX4_SETVI|nr:hypothetical protein SEVIR_5G097350v2 [Setaria viridis]
MVVVGKDGMFCFLPVSFFLQLVPAASTKHNPCCFAFLMAFLTF